MLKAQFLLRFGSNPVRVAAFCFNNLSKIQVLDTDISAAVDKILQDEMDVVSYRVLGYLLLGVVRIYSKKVEYALEDCNEMLIKINKFVGNREDFAHVETLRMSISIPKKLELDAFELDLLEDTGRDHTAPPEEITIQDKEVVCKTGGFGLFSPEKFEEFDIEDTFSSDRDKVGNARLTQLLSMMGIKVDPLSPVVLQESRDTFESSMFSLKEPMNMDSVSIVEGLVKESVNLSGQDQQIIEDHQTIPTEDEIYKHSRISQEEYIDISMFCGREEEHTSSVEEFNNFRQVDTVQSFAKETLSSVCNMNEEISEVHEGRNLKESIEKPQDKQSHEKECVYHVNASVANDIHEELIEGSVEKPDNSGKLGFQEKVSLEDERLSFTPSKSTKIDVTPLSKFQDGSVGMPNRGATTPDSILISTPAVKDHSQFSRKRRVVLDKKQIVLPNKVLVKSLSSAEDIVRKRRKYRRTSLTWKRESDISCHPDRFYEPLLPCFSPELQLLFSKKQMKLPNSLKIVETSGNLDLPESPTIRTPLSPPQLSDSIEIDETPRMLDVFESLPSDIPKHIPTVPPTLPSCTHENEFPSLMDEEINSFGTDNAKLAGWSDRTRAVASYLHKSFPPTTNEKEESVLNFSKVFGSPARKEGARLFYELLVLKTSGHVDVEQKEAYGDIAISKLPKLDQTF